VGWICFEETVFCHFLDFLKRQFTDSFTVSKVYHIHHFSEIFSGLGRILDWGRAPAKLILKGI
jgi:hypothetical protein